MAIVNSDRDEQGALDNQGTSDNSEETPVSLIVPLDSAPREIMQ
jgi:hypothetical protein